MKAQLSKLSKKLLLRLSMLFTVAAASLVLILVFLAIKTISQYYLLPSVSVNVGNVMNVKNAVKPGLPKYLIISSIDINVIINYVGLTSDGVMDINPNSSIAGWYMLGPRPGDKGSAVIAGHYGWDKNGKPAIFNDIQKLNKGDEISVVDQEGKSVTFLVREIRKYDPDSDATFVFQSSDGKSHLNLITCNGVWENDKKSYSNRLVVFADKK